MSRASSHAHSVKFMNCLIGQNAPMTDLHLAREMLGYVVMAYGVLWLFWKLWALVCKRPLERKRGGASARFTPRHDTSGSFFRIELEPDGARSFDALVSAVSGDMRAASRLVDFEMRRAPGINRQEAADRALGRLERDRS
jgi:hypothetical protein